jgi:hypothetical protein
VNSDDGAQCGKPEIPVAPASESPINFAEYSSYSQPLNKTLTDSTVPPATAAPRPTVLPATNAPGFTVPSTTNAPGHETIPQTAFKQNTEISVKKSRLRAHQRIIQSGSDEEIDKDEPGDYEWKHDTADAQAQAVEDERAELDLAFFGSK